MQMKKEFTTLLVAVEEEKLTGQERQYFRRMLTTLQAVEVQVVLIDEDEVVFRQTAKNSSLTRHRVSEYQASALVLVDHEADKERAIAANLPVVYYSHQCIGGYGADMLLMSFGEIGYDFFAQIFDRFHGQPWTILETRRCLLREAVLEDLDAFYEIYAEPSVARFIEPLSYDYEEEKEKLAAYIKHQYPFYGFGTWTILAGEKDVRAYEDEKIAQQLCQATQASAPYDAPLAIIGRAGLNIDETTGNVQLGYLIREEYQGQGIATEVCEAILKYAKNQLELTEVELCVDPLNEASIKLAKKLGFQPVCGDLTYCNLYRIYL